MLLDKHERNIPVAFDLRARECLFHAAQQSGEESPGEYKEWQWQYHTHNIV